MVTFDVTEVHIRRRSERPAAECFYDANPVVTPPVTPRNDIALLRIVPHIDPPPATPRSSTMRALQPGPITPIRLAGAGTDPAPAVPVMLTGWGATSASYASFHMMSPELNRIDIAVVARDVCATRN